MRWLRTAAVKAAIASLGLALALVEAHAQQVQPAQEQPARPNRRPPLRVEIAPRQFYRQCVDWHVIEHRPSGDTVVPRTRCQWAPRY